MRSLTTLVAAIAVFAVTAGSSNAAPVYGPHAQGITVITDTLGGNGRPPDPSAPGVRFITDTLGGNGGAVRTVTVPARDMSFSWSAAGVGAAGATGALLALLGVTLLAGRRRTRLAV